jgi:hypothetical protein
MRPEGSENPARLPERHRRKRVDQHGIETRQIRDSSQHFAGACYECRPVHKTHRHVGAERGGNARPINIGRLRSVGKAQGSQERSRIRRPAADPRGDRQSFLQRHLAELEAWSKLGDAQKRLVDEIVALDRSGEGPANAQPRILAGYQTHDVA